MDRLQTLEMFIAVADEGGFAAAARKLRVSPPAVTRGIAELEARLGVVLFHRSTRAVTLTDEGNGFLTNARRIINELDEAERQLSGSQSSPHGQLYVTAPVAFGRLHVLPVVSELLDRHPDLSVRMMLVDRNVRIIEEGIDVAVRIGQLADSALKAVRIGNVRQVLVASPGYLARYGVPSSHDDLGRHQIIATTGPRAATEWRFGQRRDPVSVQGRLLVNTIDAAVDATEAGVGIANLLSYQAAAGLDAGRLVEVLRPDVPVGLPVHLLFEASRAATASTRTFIDAMRDRGLANAWS